MDYYKFQQNSKFTLSKLTSPVEMGRIYCKRNLKFQQLLETMSDGIVPYQNYFVEYGFCAKILPSKVSYRRVNFKLVKLL